MPNFLRYILFFLLAPIMTLTLLFFSFTFGREGSGVGWYQDLWGGNFLQLILAIVLAPIYFPLKWFLEFVYPFWDGLVDM